MTRESTIERAFVKAVRLRGGWAIKLWPMSVTGLPDRLVLFWKLIFFCELKAPGKKATKLQEIIHKRIRAYGFEVIVIDRTALIEDKLNEVGTPPVPRQGTGLLD